ncbi:MAG: hypothetical protein ACI96G_001459 [Flavobacterium sp.]|jgi:hypothetical protein
MKQFIVLCLTIVSNTEQYLLVHEVNKIQRWAFTFFRNDED